MTTERRRILLAGRVQGVGMRPFLYRLAGGLGLGGSVSNVLAGVEIEVEGPASAVAAFTGALGAVRRPAVIDLLTSESVPPRGQTVFRISPTRAPEGEAGTVPVDVAPCEDCLGELLDRNDRRYLHPFVSCAACGPRFTVLDALPFDREHTALAAFPLCGACRREFEDPANRRFHAQTLSCPACGPRLWLADSKGVELAGGTAAIAAAVALLDRGGILALKGVGGFQLVADARSGVALSRLRQGKQRPGKPFALMVMTVAAARALSEVDCDEAAALRSPEAPIVLLRRKADAGICGEVAPHSPYLGIMLPSSPVHHLLLRQCPYPLVVTSGNRHGEPLCIGDEAFAALAGMADLFLVHDRSIRHRADDAVVRVRQGKARVLRLGRGFAPLSLPVVEAGPPVLGVGGQEKNAFALTLSGRLVLSQHVGDLASPGTFALLGRETKAFTQLFRRDPVVAVGDLHPDYQALPAAAALEKAVLRVQHHHAHVLSCVAEHGVRGPVLGVAWDGAGLGSDRTVWGGEFLGVDGTSCARVAHLRTFSLPGGDLGAREPRRALLGALFEIMGDAALDPAQSEAARAFTPRELALLAPALARGVNCPRASSVGRLFDAVASLLGLCQKALYAEQAPVALEGLAGEARVGRTYAFDLVWPEAGPGVLDWRPLLAALRKDRAEGVAAAAMALGFHEALAEAVTAVARRSGHTQVVLTGGVFQNALLCSLTEAKLEAAGLRVHTHVLVPAGDGGLAVGQALYGVLRLRETEVSPCV